MLCYVSKAQIVSNARAKRKDYLMSASLPGVYPASKKDGSIYYRASITYKGNHISLGSYKTAQTAHAAYKEADALLTSDEDKMPEDYPNTASLSFFKWVILTNYHNNHIYIKTPVYLKERYFHYYLSKEEFLIFDADDLFYYSTHSIMKRGGHLFVSDYGMQVNILSRYSIKNFAVPGRDYRFANGNTNDYRYENIIIINRYHGVTCEKKGVHICYTAKIHINGNTIIGRYETEELAAIAYNKAAKILQKKGCRKNFPINYLENLTAAEYQNLYENISISHAIHTMQF